MYSYHVLLVLPKRNGGAQWREKRKKRASEKRKKTEKKVLREVIDFTS